MVPADWTLPRPELDRRLDGALTHRLTTLVAAPGYGKSTALGRWTAAVGGIVYRIGPGDRDLTTFAGGVVALLRSRAQDVPAAVIAAVDAPLGPDAVVGEMSRADALAGAVGDALGGQGPGNVVLVLDGLEHLANARASRRFAETIVRSAPLRSHIVIASNEPLPFPIERLRRDHDVLELDANDLALRPAETVAWVEHRFGPGHVDLADALHRATGGWPMAIHAAIDAMESMEPKDRASVVADVSATSAELDELTRLVYDRLPRTTRKLLQAAVIVPSFDVALVDALGAPPGTLDAVVSLGMFVDVDDHGHRLTPTTRQVLQRHAPLSDADLREVVGTAARWYVDNDSPDLAIRVAMAAGRRDLVGSLLDMYGDRLVDHPDDVLAAISWLTDGQEARDAADDHLRIAGLAQFNRGDWDAARAALERVTRQGTVDASVAFRIGVIDHLRGDLFGAVAAYQRGADDGYPAVDAAMCTAMAAAVTWLQGDNRASRALADEARTRAAELGDHGALAAAHTAMAMVAAYDGDGRANDAHYVKALDHATRAGDVAQEIRIRCNRASHWHEEGRYADALAEAEIAIGLCDLTGFAPWTALARSNRAESLIRLGRLEEAAVDARAAVEHWEAMGSRLVAYGLSREAEILALRGQAGAAAEAFQRAIDLCEQAGDRQGLGTALIGFAGLRVGDDPVAAAALASRALENPLGTLAASAYVVAARAACAAGRFDDARDLTDRAQVEAAQRRERASLAEVALLRATLDGSADHAAVAVAQWKEIDDPVGLARAELTKARLDDPRRGLEVAAEVRSRMLAIGCRVLDDEIDALLARAAPADVPRIAVQTLGAFRVLRDGVPIPTAQWHSKKARDLLKVLITRRGRPIPRHHLAETLWPEAAAADDPAALKRLNVMISTLRAVLDPDHEWSPDHFVESKAGALRVELSHIRVDVIDLLDRVREASVLDHAGREHEALELWQAVEAAYVGDFCEEDVYADWAAGMREEARLAYAQAAARIAEWEASVGNVEQSARLWLRLLERDPFDERAHLALVRVFERAGRRADARRRYQVYADRMRELDVEPAPYPT